MSQLTHPKPHLGDQVRSHKLIAIAGLLALLATTAIVLVLAIGDNQSTTSSVVDTPQPAVRADNGPEESAVAAAIGSPPPVAKPDESKIAAAISRGYEPTPAPAPVRPDESTVASAISGR